MAHILNYIINIEPGDLQNSLLEISQDLNNEINNLALNPDNDYELVIIYSTQVSNHQLIYSRIINALVTNPYIQSYDEHHSNYSNEYVNTNYITASIAHLEESNNYQDYFQHGSNLISQSNQNNGTLIDVLQIILNEFNTSYGEVVLTKGKLNHESVIMLSLPNSDIKIMLIPEVKLTKYNTVGYLYNNVYTIVLSNNPGIFNQFRKEIKSEAEFIELIKLIRNENSNSVSYDPSTDVNPSGQGQSGDLT